jgi:enoyl-CoA hydratase/carnithine racemase
MLNGKIVSAENCSELEIVSSVPEDEAEEEVVLIAEK